MAAVNARQFKHTSLLLLLCVALQSVGRSVSQCEPHAVPCPESPVCNQMPHCCFTANEEEEVGVVVGNVNVVTAIHTVLTDQTGSIYLIQEDPYFELNATTGAVRVKDTVDREVVGDCVLLGVGIITEAGSSQPAVVGVLIQDVNDNTPSFTSPSVTIEEDETDELVSWICIDEYSALQATDDDIGSNGNINYSIGGAAEDMFEIGADTCIRNTVPIDRDSIQEPQTTEVYSLSLLVIATDGGVIPRNSSINLTITVRDKNDNPPEFTAESLQPVTVLENIMEGTVIRVLEAYDPDYNSELTYTLDLTTTLPFVLNATSGQLLVGGSLTYTAEGYTLSVQVTDSENHIEAELHVIVVNVNENATIVPFREIPVIVHVVEESSYTSLLFYEITDPDDAAEEDFSVELLGVQSDHFVAVVSKRSFFFSISISLDPPIDLEALVDETGNATFVLIILVTEFGVPNISHIFEHTITVEGINDNDPFLVMTEFEFREEQTEGSRIEQLEGRDLDIGSDGTVESYCIISATAQSKDLTETKDLTDAFVMHNNNLHCLSAPPTLKAPKIDREDGADVVVIVMNLTDGGGHSNISIITVNIIDVNDNFPNFLSTEFKFTFTEGQEPIYIGTVSAFDSDTGANAEVEFELLDHRDLFTVNGTTGEVRTLTEFDREEEDMYIIEVKVRNVAELEDNADDSDVNDTATIIVTVRDINDSPPEWKNVQTDITITSDFEVGEFVAVLTATDADLEENSDITYTLDPAELFNVSMLGVINVAGSLENKIGTYSLTLTASNTAKPHHMACLNITIEVEHPDAATDSSVAIYGSISGTILFVLLAIVVLFIVLLFVYVNKRRQSVNLSNKNGRPHSNGVNSPTRGILRQIPSTSIGFTSRSNSTNGTGRGVKFDDKVQKIGYDDDHAVSNNVDVFFTESSIHLDSSGDESPQTPPRLHSVHHNGKLPSDGHSHSPNGAVRLSPIQENFLYSHQNYPLQEAYNGLNLYDEDSEVQSDDDSTLPDNASSTNAPLPSVRHLQQYKSSPKHGMSRMPPSPHSSPPTSHLAPLPPMGQISPSHQFPLSPEHRATHTPPPLHDQLSSQSSSTDSLTPSPHPQHESSHVMRQTSRSTYPVHMPEGYVIPPSTHSAVPSRFPAESFMDPFEGTDYGDASTYASAELDEALNFHPDLEPGIYSLTATSSVYSYDNEESQL